MVKRARKAEKKPGPAAGKRVEPWNQSITIEEEGRKKTLSLKQIASDYLRMNVGKGQKLSVTKKRLGEIKDSFVLLREANALKEKGVAYEEISRRLSVPVSTVKTWLTLKYLPRELSFEVRKARLASRTKTANTILRDNSRLYLVGASLAGLQVKGRKIRVLKQHKRVPENIAKAAGRITEKEYAAKEVRGRHVVEIGSTQLVQEINKLTNNGREIPRALIAGPMQRDHLVRGFVDMRAIITSREQNLLMQLNNEAFRKFFLRELGLEGIKYNYNPRSKKITITRLNLPRFFTAFGINGETLVRERMKQS